MRGRCGRCIRGRRDGHRSAAAAGVWAAAVVGLACAAGDDPFADLQVPSAPAAVPGVQPEAAAADWTSRILGEGGQFKKEILGQVSGSDGVDAADGLYTRESVGFEVLKRFSTPTSTVASFDAQVRFVRRDDYMETISDMEGAEREGWFLEYHNLYLDAYNVLNPLLDDAGRGANVGRFNARVGRFYLPFGLNLQTDTHATLLQLSNDRNFGFERDWYAGLYGGLSRSVNYDLYYLAGSGYDLSWKGQQGMVGSRLSLGNRFANELGLEGGLSLLAGERLAPHSVMRSASVAAESDADAVVDTLRVGPDLRYTRAVPGGTATYTTEWSVGRDESDDVLTQLHQLDYLTRSRRWGVSAQYRRFWQDIGAGDMGDMPPDDADASLIGEVAWHLRNDIGSANLHSVRLNVEQRLERQDGDTGTIVSLQYYRYW